MALTLGAVDLFTEWHREVEIHFSGTYFVVMNIQGIPPHSIYKVTSFRDHPYGKNSSDNTLHPASDLCPSLLLPGGWTAIRRFTLAALGHCQGRE
jgi:hypothetical protein